MSHLWDATTSILDEARRKMPSFATRNALHSPGRVTTISAGYPTSGRRPLVRSRSPLSGRNITLTLGFSFSLLHKHVIPTEQPTFSTFHSHCKPATVRLSLPPNPLLQPHCSTVWTTSTWKQRALCSRAPRDAGRPGPTYFKPSRIFSRQSCFRVFRSPRIENQLSTPTTQSEH